MGSQFADELLKTLKKTNRKLRRKEPRDLDEGDAEAAITDLETLINSCDPDEAGPALLASGHVAELAQESAMLGRTAAEVPTLDVLARCADSVNELLARPLFADKLRATREVAGYGVRELARASGVSNAYISQMEHAHASPPSLKVAGRIARALGIAPEDLADFYPPALMPPLGDSDRAAVMRDPAVQEFLSIATELTPDQRRLLVEIARTIRRFTSDE